MMRKLRELLLVLGLLSAISFGFIGWGVFSILKANETKSWPLVKGIVITSKIESEFRSSGTGRRRRSRKVYLPRVYYQYGVNKTTYTSEQISVGEYVKLNELDASEFIRSYPKGSNVDVYYNPRNPQDALLLPGETSDDLSIYVGILLLVMSWGVGGIYAYKLNKV